MVSAHFLVHSLRRKLHLLIMPKTGSVSVRVECAHRAVRRVRTVACADCSLRRLPGIVGRLHKGVGLWWNGKTEGVSTPRREAVKWT